MSRCINFQRKEIRFPKENRWFFAFSKCLDFLCFHRISFIFFAPKAGLTCQTRRTVKIICKTAAATRKRMVKRPMDTNATEFTKTVWGEGLFERSKKNLKLSFRVLIYFSRFSISGKFAHPSCCHYYYCEMNFRFPQATFLAAIFLIFTKLKFASLECHEILFFLKQNSWFLFKI